VARVSKRANGRATAQRSGLDAEAAVMIANGFLIDTVGDLLMAEAPRLFEGRWIMTIAVGNVIQGMLGQVGTISIDATSGEVLFSEEDRSKVKARARELARASS